MSTPLKGHKNLTPLPELNIKVPEFIYLDQKDPIKTTKTLNNLSQIRSESVKHDFRRIFATPKLEKNNEHPLKSLNNIRIRSCLKPISKYIIEKSLNIKPTTNHESTFITRNNLLKSPDLLKNVEQNINDLKLITFKPGESFIKKERFPRKVFCIVNKKKANNY